MKINLAAFGLLLAILSFANPSLVLSDESASAAAEADTTTGIAETETANDADNDGGDEVIVDTDVEEVDVLDIGDERLRLHQYDPVEVSSSQNDAENRVRKR